MQDYRELMERTFDDIVQIGAGGGGIIYKAHHKRLDKDVVLKKILNAKSGSIDRRAEMSILKNLKHNYIPQIFDFLEYGDDVFTVMEYIPGQSFAQLLEQKKQFSQKEVAKWLLQLCEVVTYLHAQNPPIIHCDIKPANVMLTPQGDICLIDFNISGVKSEDGIAAIGYSRGYAPVEQFAVVTKRLEEQVNTTERSMSTVVNAGAADVNGVIDITEIVDDLTFVPDDGRIPIPVDDQTDIVGNIKASGVKIEKELEEKHKGKSKKKSKRKVKKLEDMEKSLIAGVSDSEWTAAKKIQRSLGKELFVDERTDIYSIGATMYHIATGVRPVPFYEKQRTLRSVNENLSESLIYIIERAMEINPADRFKSMKQMLKMASNIGTVDKRYKALARRQFMSIVVNGLLIVASALSLSHGKNTMVQEKEEQYLACVSTMNEALTERDYEVLLDSYESALQLNSTGFEAKYILALSYYEQKQYEECAEYVLQVLHEDAELLHNEQFGKLYYVIAGCFFELENYEQAVPYYEQALEHSVNEVSYYRDYVIALARCGDLNKAEEILAVAKQYGLSGDSLSLLNGEIAILKGKYAECEQYLRECIEATADDYVRLRAYTKLDDAYQEMYTGEEQYEMRILLLKEALDVLEADNRITLMERLAQVYINYSDIKDMQYYCENAIALFKEMEVKNYATFTSRYNIAVLYEKMGMYAEAQQQLEKMDALYANNYTIYKRLAFVELQAQAVKENAARDYAKFKEYYDEAYALYRENARGDDVEMLSLQQLYDDVVANGWLER